MAVIKSSIFVSTCNALHNLSPSAVSCSTSYKHLSTRDARYQRQRKQESRRRYATVARDIHSQHSASASPDKDRAWPDAPRGYSCPTPYQILQTSKDAAYTKARFYELVKLYHPDCNPVYNDGTRGVSHSVRLDRYRLIVAAHAILSDPVKRKAYDQWGTGWTGRIEDPSFNPYQPQANPYAGPFTSWREQQDANIWSNATWEDWERWRESQKNGGKSRDPVSVQNSAFVGLLLLFVAIGALNINRADNEGQRFLASRDMLHDQASKELRRVRQLSHERSRVERIDWFLRNREATLTGTKPEELQAEGARRILPPEERCIGQDMQSE